MSKVHKISFESVSAVAHPEAYAGDNPAMPIDEVPDAWWSQIETPPFVWPARVDQWNTLRAWAESGEQLIRNVRLFVDDRPDPSWREVENPYEVPVDDGIVRIPIDEFQRLGFLQEANRLFFHPLGLALEVLVADDGSKRLGGVWDYRDDPEGMVFGDLTDEDAAVKCVQVNQERDRHRTAREVLLGGGIIQPLGSTIPPATPPTGST